MRISNGEHVLDIRF